MYSWIICFLKKKLTFIYIAILILGPKNVPVDVVRDNGPTCRSVVNESLGKSYDSRGKKKISSGVNCTVSLVSRGWNEPLSLVTLVVIYLFLQSRFWRVLVMMKSVLLGTNIPGKTNGVEFLWAVRITSSVFLSCQATQCTKPMFKLKAL